MYQLYHIFHVFVITFVLYLYLFNISILFRDSIRINNHNYVDMEVADFVLHNKFIDTFPTSLPTLICKFLIFQYISDLWTKAK